jgi:hypothetical protein
MPKYPACNWHGLRRSSREKTAVASRSSTRVTRERLTRRSGGQWPIFGVSEWTPPKCLFESRCAERTVQVANEIVYLFDTH